MLQKRLSELNVNQVNKLQNTIQSILQKDRVDILH